IAPDARRRSLRKSGMCFRVSPHSWDLRGLRHSFYATGDPVIPPGVLRCAAIRDEVRRRVPLLSAAEEAGKPFFVLSPAISFGGARGRDQTQIPPGSARPSN